MRFEVGAAYVIGAGLPILETGRRGISHWLVNATTMGEDYLAGGLLLLGAWMATRKHPYALAFLVLAWAYGSGMMFGSFWGQLEFTIRGADLEANNTLVVVVKAILWSTCVTGLILSLRRLLPLLRKASEPKA